MYLRALTRKYPLEVGIEPTTRCNLKCKYCGRMKAIQKGFRDVGDIDFNLAKKIVMELAKLPNQPRFIEPEGLVNLCYTIGIMKISLIL